MKIELTEGIEKAGGSSASLTEVRDSFVVREAATSFFGQRPSMVSRLLASAPVSSSAFEYWDFSLDDTVKDNEAGTAAPGLEVDTVGITGTKHTSDILLRGLKAMVPDLVAVEDTTGIPQEEQATEMVLTGVNNTIDKDLADNVVNKDDSLGSDISVNPKWDADDGDFIKDVLGQADVLISNGAMADSLVLGVSRRVWTGLRQGTKVRQAVRIPGYAAEGPVPTTAEVSATIDGIPIVVLDNLAGQGNWRFGDHAVLLASPAMASARTPNAVTMFTLNKANFQNPMNAVPRVYREDRLGVTYYQVLFAYRILVQNAQLGARFKSAVTAN